MGGWEKGRECRKKEVIFYQNRLVFNPISQGVSISLPPRGGGYLIPPLGNQGRSSFWPHVAKSYFETYKSYDHMQNFRPLSQKFSEISRFEKFEFLRFCLTLTPRNCQYRAHILDLFHFFGHFLIGRLP